VCLRIMRPCLQQREHSCHDSPSHCLLINCRRLRLMHVYWYLTSVRRSLRQPPQGTGAAGIVSRVQARARAIRPRQETGLVEVELLRQAGVAAGTLWGPHLTMKMGRIQAP